MFFKAKGNVSTAELSAHAPTARVVVRSCRNLEKHWPGGTEENQGKC
jgi:hypothetical protein